RRHTRFDCDWSSDVCSSDLSAGSRRRTMSGKSSIGCGGCKTQRAPRSQASAVLRPGGPAVLVLMLRRDLLEELSLLEEVARLSRSEERRVGKESKCWVWWYR